MKVVALLGSPRPNGNSAAIAGRLIETFENLDAETDTVSLNKLKMFNDIYPKYELFFQFLGFQNNRLIRACGVNDAKDHEKRQDIMQLAEETAQQIMAGPE